MTPTPGGDPPSCCCLQDEPETDEHLPDRTIAHRQGVEKGLSEEGGRGTETDSSKTTSPNHIRKRSLGAGCQPVREQPGAGALHPPEDIAAVNLRCPAGEPGKI